MRGLFLSKVVSCNLSHLAHPYLLLSFSQRVSAMPFDFPLASNTLNLTLVAIGGLVLLLGIVSDWLKRKGLSDRLVALAVGVALGPVGLNVLDPAHWGNQTLIIEEVARLTLGVGLMGVALRIPWGFMKREWRSVLTVVVAAMVGMWALSSIIAAFTLGLALWPALLLGAVVTPTDPIAASSVVTGAVAEKNLPDRLRHLLSAESGFNHGLAYLFVVLPLLMLEGADAAVAHWLGETLLWEVGGAVVLGGLLGFGGGHAARWAEEHNVMERTSYLAFTVALALAVLGAVKLIGSDGLLAVFVAGVLFDAVVSVEERTEEKRVVEALDRFFGLPIFALLGLVLPWQEWLALGWPGVAFALVLLLLRRLPVLLLLTPHVKLLPRRRDALFLGWFGPVGVAALFYASLALHRVGLEEVWAAATLAIATSVLIHGLTATPFTKWYGQHAPPPDANSSASHPAG
jgi:NhaP-type Na+/H+ or K+/H+ antiporter